MLSETNLKIVIEWAIRIAEVVADSGRGLSDEEINVARSIGVSFPRKVRILKLEEMPSVPHEVLALAEEHLNLKHASGIALGYAILVRQDSFSDRLLKHELKHVEQSERLGGMNCFLHTYLSQVLEHGYKNAPLEVEAREAESLS